MKKIIFIVVMSLVVGGLMYMNDPARKGDSGKGNGIPTGADQPSVTSQGPLDRMWAWLGGDNPAGNTAGGANAGPVQTPGGTPRADEPKRASGASISGPYIISTTDRDFDSDVMTPPVPVVVDFWRPGCPYCVQLDPELDKLASELSGRVKVVKVNIYECTEIRRRYPISGVPTVFLFENGKFTRQLGGRTAGQLKSELGL